MSSASISNPGATASITSATAVSLSLASWDVQVADIAARAAYNSEAAGFSVLVSDTGSGRAAVYTKNSAASGDWSDPAYYTGPTGATGATGPAGADGIDGADGADGNGFLWRAQWALYTDYAINDVAFNNDVSYVCVAAHTADNNDEPGVGAGWDAKWDVFSHSDMLASIYDPTGAAADAFDMDNMIEGTDTKIMTAAERTKLASLSASASFDTVALLLADTDMAYSSGSPTVSSGDIVEAGGHRYEVAASGASDNDVVTAGSVKLYVLRGAGGYYVDAFGAAGDGVTDDTDEFNAAIAKLNDTSNPEVLILTGNYVVSGSLDAITTRRKVIFAYGATINHDSGTLFTFDVGADACVLKGLQYFCPTSPTSGTCLIEIDGANQCCVIDVTGRCNAFAKIGLTTFVGGYLFDNINLSTVNGTQTLVDHGTGAVSQINNFVGTALSTSRTLDETTATGATATGFKFSDAWDTAMWNGILMNGYLYGLDVNLTANNVNISNFRLSNFYFDFCANGIRLKNSATGGGINNWLFVNGWVVGMDGYGVQIDTGSYSQISFVNVQSMLAGKNNWRISGTGFTDVSLERCVGQFANRYNATNTGSDQDDCVLLSGGVHISNCRFGQSANNFVTTSVPNWQGRYGINASPSIDNFEITNTRLEGSTADCSMNYTATKLSSGKYFASIVKNNTVVGGAARPAYAATSTVTAPTSAATQTNDTPFVFTLYIYGGTVTGVNHNGTTVSGSGDLSLVINPGDTWSVTYSSAPTIRRVIHP